jgi:alkylation response protein AidB-like acyl-CoA dehydrogenase
MDIEFTDEQKILQDSVERMLRASYDFDRRRAIIASEDGWSEPHWQEFANLGLLAAPFSEESGGLGGGPIETMIIMEAFGRHLVLEPYFETVVLAGGLIEALGADAQPRASRRHHVGQDTLGAGAARGSVASGSARRISDGPTPGR